MKKLLSILTLLVVAVTGVWGADFVTFTTSSSGPSFPMSVGGVKLTQNGDFNVKNQTGGASDISTEIGLPSSKVYMISFKGSALLDIDAGEGKKITSVTIFAGRNSSGNASSQFGHGGFSTDKTSWSEISALSAKGYDYGTKITVTPMGNYRYYSFGRGKLGSVAPESNAEARIYKVVVSVESNTPTLTGAWKIGDEEVTGAELIKGADAPTVPTFVVGATSGTPDADDYTVAYSLKEGSTAGIFTFTENGGITAISTATAGTATMVATLSSKHIENFLNADPNTFEYTVTVSAAAAPTFTSVTPSATNVLKGTASTITAVVEGSPDPTVTWYSCDDAEKTNSVEAGTGLVLNLTNDVTGTFYYYAVATNSIGSATSDVQTISVKEKLATPTVSGDRYFLESVTATIEGPEGATVKFKKNGGAEETYVAKTVISSNEDMELQVWAEKDGFLSSDKVTVNFKKVTDTGVTAVEEVSSWDWSKPKKKSETSADVVEPSPVKLETLLSEIDAFNYDDFGPALTSIKYINAQRFTVKDDYVQAHGLVIKTSVSGKLDFKVRGTNSNTRYVVVNGENAGTVNSPSSDKNINSIAIPVGTTVVYGLDEASQAANNLRYYNVTFTPAVNVTSEGWATTTTPSYAVDFDENAEVYIATAAGENITLTKITDAPANTAVVVNAAAGSYTMTKKAEATTDVSKNLLKSSDGSVVGTTTGSPYVLGKNLSNVVGFGPLAKDVTLAAGKAYILASAFPAAKDFYPFVIGDEENETTSINSIENGESRIENSDYIYNLAGQKVSKDYKGIVIVNGKKVIRK